MTFEEAKQTALATTQPGPRMAETSLERAKTGFSSAGNIGGLWFGYTRRPNQSRCILAWNGLISALEVGGDHLEAGLEYYRRETRPATEAEEKETVKYLRARNYTHFKLSKRCALKR